MTPEKFRDIMIDIKNDYNLDTEVAHIEMDELMCKVLIELGYDEGVEIFRTTDKWYA